MTDSGGGQRTDTSPEGRLVEHVLAETTVVNEFGAALIRKISTRNGERLEISSPNLGYAIRLDALQLEALSWQNIETISQLLETPLGPEGDHHG